MIDDPWYHKRTEYLLENTKQIESDGRFDYLNQDSLKWVVYSVDKLSRDWSWDISDDYWIGHANYELYANMMGFASVFQRRHKMTNPICISVGENYWVHPGTTRYFVNKVCNDVDLSAIIIDTSGGFNENKIYSDFPDVQPYMGELKFSYSQVDNTYWVKPTSISIDTKYYQLEYENIVKLFELDFSVDVWCNGKHFLTVPNSKPKKSFKVDGMKGLAQLSIHLLSDPNYQFEELFYERQ
tara:strand:- start:6172 stop:6891 length:720 start_codon:yes stop_codon:yes gene_type:complete